MLYVLHDHNANVIGLTDEHGQLIAQYSYTPYGELSASEFFTPDSSSLASAEAVTAAQGNVLGHQGLRAQRFDRPWDGAMDLTSVVSTGTGATGPYRCVYHNRNRVYDPSEGRFIEDDPNGLGVPVLDDDVFGGQAISAADVAMDVQIHYGDGMNAYVAYGLAPLRRQDALGLMSAMDAAEAPIALGALEAAKVQIMMFTVQNWAAVSVATSLAYGVASGDGDPMGVSNPGMAMELNTLVQGAARGSGQELLSLAGSSFRQNMIRLGGTPVPRIVNGVEEAVQAHHIIPEAEAITKLLRDLGIADIQHNPIFGQWLTQAEHAAVHAGSTPGGVYNQVWEAELQRLVRNGVRGDDALRDVMDFIVNDIGPRYLW